MSEPLPPLQGPDFHAALVEVESRRRETVANLVRVQREHAFIHRYAGNPVPDAILPFTDEEMREMGVMPTRRVEALLEQILAAVAAPERKSRAASTRRRAAPDEAATVPARDVRRAEPEAPVVPEPEAASPSRPGHGPETPVETASVDEVPSEPLPEAVPSEVLVPAMIDPPAADVASMPSDAVRAHVPAAPAEKTQSDNRAKVSKAIALLLAGLGTKRITAQQIIEAPSVLQNLHYVQGERHRLMELKTVLADGVMDGKWMQDPTGYGARDADAGGEI